MTPHNVSIPIGGAESLHIPSNTVIGIRLCPGRGSILAHARSPIGTPVRDAMDDVGVDVRTVSAAPALGSRASDGSNGGGRGGSSSSPCNLWLAAKMDALPALGPAVHGRPPERSIVRWTPTSIATATVVPGATSPGRSGFLSMSAPSAAKMNTARSHVGRSAVPDLDAPNLFERDARRCGPERAPTSPFGFALPLLPGAPPSLGGAWGSSASIGRAAPAPSSTRALKGP